MATINYAAREISVKIVYYGPALSGKTTNLQIIHRKIPQHSKSDMVSLATETDRTLFFDFLPLDLGKIRGFTTKFQLYTVPGQVYYNATRKLVLRGVDGIVFIADSAADKYDENVESFINMEENLAEYGYKQESIPVILQYNKRDLPNALITDELNAKFNKYNLMWSEAVASKGKGVFESLKLIGKLVIDHLNQKYSSSSKKRTANQEQNSMQDQPFQDAKPASMTNQPFEQQSSQFQSTQSPPPFQQQQDQNVMKYGEINVEPIDPESYPAYSEQMSTVENTSEYDSGNESYENNISKTNKYFETPPFNQNQPPLPNEQPNPNHSQNIQMDFEPQNTPQPLKEPVHDPSKPRSYQYNESSNTMHESASFPKYNTQSQYYTQPQQYAPDQTTQGQGTQQIPQGNQYAEDSFGQDPINKPMYFTSINKEKQRKKGKKPINPKHKSKQSFFSKLFKWGG